VTIRLSRAGFVRRAAAGGGALLVSSSALNAFTGSAAAAVPDGDLSSLRLLIGAELLSADFQGKALASGKLSNRSARWVKAMLADENAHYKGLSTLMVGAGEVPATGDDINFAYPKGSFGTESAVMKLAAKIEELTLGAYLGAVGSVQTPELRIPIGQIAANEAQHVSALASAAGKSPIGQAFAPVLQVDTVSAALDQYES
jgi:hypothetical protein